MSPVSLSDRAWPELVGRHPLLAVPVGSTEQHGPHLPLDTDSRVAVAAAQGLAAVRADVVVAPLLPVTSSGEHRGFPGTLSIGAAVFEEMLVELARSADHFSGIVWVCGHGGNSEPLGRVVERLAAEGRRSLAYLCGVPGGDAHAGRSETSLMLALAGESVRMDRAEAGNDAPWSELSSIVRRDGVRAASPNGVLGDPAGASEAEGRDFLDGIVARLVDAVARWNDD